MTQHIPISQITPNPNQPRKHFDKAKLRQLADTIAARGLIQPITVRPLGGRPMRYMIVAGERRWRAHKLLEKEGKAETIRANVEKMGKDEMALQAIIENKDREDINPIEQALAYQDMIDRGWTVEKLAAELGMKQPRRISDRLLLLGCCDTIRQLVASGQFSTDVAYHVAGLPEHEQMLVLKAFNAGKTDIGYLKAMVQALIDKRNQSGMFGDDDQPSPEGGRQLKSMENRIEQIVKDLSRGWKDGECVIAKSVDPNRAGRIAEQLQLIAKTANQMARAMTQAQAARELF
ncbi:MAG: ParB/RepB/Spo0J family partition protein [Nitratireductor sp.]|nr:ParB/RepB/Spo0J family partition protein [Nitratireductor sp.]